MSQILLNNLRSVFIYNFKVMNFNKNLIYEHRHQILLIMFDLVMMVSKMFLNFRNYFQI